MQKNFIEQMKLQNSQYQTALYLEGSVLPGAQKKFHISVTAIGPFFCTHFTGDYTSTEEVAEDLTDTGVCPVRIQITDQTNSRPLMNEPIPANLLLSPGSRRDPLAVNNGDIVDRSSFLLPYEWYYCFPQNGTIEVLVKNDSNVAQEVRMAFRGYRLKLTNSDVVGA